MSNDIIEQNNSNNAQAGTQADAIKFGIIGGFAGILVSLILFFLNLQFESWSKWLQSAIMLIVIVLGLKTIADSNKNGSISFGTLFKSGMLITFIIAIISVIYFLIYSNFIETDFIDKILAISRTRMEAKGLSDEQIDRALEMSKSFMSPTIMTVISLISTLLIGAIFSLIGAAIYKKEK